ncbi:MAG: glutaredoxin [Pseudomonadota bacterium]|nr:glutaredoxin [Pseudomonadota bacterium]
MPFDQTKSAGTEPPADAPRKAVLHRMATPDHLCPFGLKSLSLLKRAGYEVEDRKLETREATDAFMEAHGVKTTPQTFVGGERIGGYDDLRAWLGKPLPDPEATTYRPIAALLAVAALMGLAIAWAEGMGAGLAVGDPGGFDAPRALTAAVASAMCLLGMLKLQDVEGFSTMFLGYDLLARRHVPYAYAYPYLETGAGLLMLAGAAPWLSGPVALVIGTVGAVSVIKAVWIDRRSLKCACLGSGSRTPLGAVSLGENLGMAAMGLAALAGLVLPA